MTFEKQSVNSCHETGVERLVMIIIIQFSLERTRGSCRVYVMSELKSLAVKREDKRREGRIKRQEKCVTTTATACFFLSLLDLT